MFIISAYSPVLKSIFIFRTLTPNVFKDVINQAVMFMYLLPTYLLLVQQNTDVYFFHVCCQHVYGKCDLFERLL